MTAQPETMPAAEYPGTRHISSRTALVVGAGIAGLASALALHRAGWHVDVIERGPRLRATGGGIGITPNGMLALDALGTGAAIRRCAVVQAEGGVRTPSGRWLARTSLAFVDRRYGVGIHALLRIDLVEILAAALPTGTVSFGAPAELVHGGGPDRPAEVRVGGDVRSAALVVGADGIRSGIRRVVYPLHPGLRYAGSVSWRAVVDAAGLAVVPAETWGAGLRFSVLPLGAGRVHFSAMARMAEPADLRDRLAGLFEGWHDPIPQLLARAAGGTVHVDAIEKLAEAVDRCSIGRVVMVGDAAHPMEPNVGLANLALEDAVELGHALRAGDGWRELRCGLLRYEDARRTHVASLTRMSGWMGRVAGLRSPSLVAVRNAAVRVGGLLPEAVSARSLDAMVGWRPPPPSAQ
ncbi:MAG: FAD-dependent monooxygenase [Pseudonocardia sp.]